ncbi:hypothetical protein F5882DRAFT_380286 [Hyaloscypha sp. PMI_1271]|nr:hypothetical protein F5882DRAFT_380286 [Hyaloscypha sp. PMI_1271]
MEVERKRGGGGGGVGRRPPDAESKGWGKGRVCERRPQLISRGRARAWATQRSRHAAQHKRGPEEDLAATASSVARLWARGQGQARKGICGVRDSAQVMCCVVAALSTGQPDQNASPASVPLTHPLPLPPPLPRPLARRLCLSLAGSARTLRGIIVKLRSTVRNSQDRQTDTCPLLQELLRAGLGLPLPPELPPNCPLRPLAADTLLRRYGSSRLLLSPVDISIVGQTRNFSGLQFPGPVKFLPAAYRDYHTSPPAPPNCCLPVLLAQLAACLCRSRWCRDEFVNRDRQMVFESSSGNGTVCLMTLSEAKDDTSCN